MRKRVKGNESMYWGEKEQRDWAACAIMDKWLFFRKDDGHSLEQRKKYDDAVIKEN